MNSNLTPVVRLLVKQTFVIQAEYRDKSLPVFRPRNPFQARQLERGHFGIYLLLCSNVKRVKYSNLIIPPLNQFVTNCSPPRKKLCLANKIEKYYDYNFQYL